MNYVRLWNYFDASTREADVNEITPEFEMMQNFKLKTNNKTEYGLL